MVLPIGLPRDPVQAPPRWEAEFAPVGEILCSPVRILIRHFATVKCGQGLTPKKKSRLLIMLQRTRETVSLHPT